ncbi:PIG-P-domain-containing protein [Ophiobolus disseminans]|uniref:PIG-P-domain-containing protein n=1 Tax=Ophiobolus disseminans TaxID=1469910 RepID=A0A6A6ZSW8_9PLEO|nr:PIG-P-domain-containing protein [Ophiobolus disseminans]
MPPKSRGKPILPGLQSKSTPDLTTLRSFQHVGIQDPSVPTWQQADIKSSNDVRLEAVDVDNDEDEEEDALGREEPESSDTEEEEEDRPPTHRPLYTSRSHSQVPRQMASQLFPPFYNRPPIPLPPSPSLTSLLRPSFASRPTTPDSSDIDLPGGLKAPKTATSTRASSTSNLANSARHAPTVPRAAPKVPTYEYYGFALYLGSSAAFLMYILWAYVPAPMLHQMGIYYYPNRWWALAIPCWLIALIVYIYVALASYNTGHLTLPLNSIENLVDQTAQVAVVDRHTGKIMRDQALLTDSLHEKDKEKDAGANATPSHRGSFPAHQFLSSDDVEWKEFWSTGTDAVMDVPIGGVCEILYGSES